MNTPQSAIILSAFGDHASAQQATHLLQNAGFTQFQLVHPNTPFTNGGTFQQNLLDQGVSKDVARYYSKEYQSGHPVLLVEHSNQDNQVLKILQNSGGYGPHLQRTSAQTQLASTSTTSSTTQSQSPNAHTHDTMTDKQSVQLREEQLRASKERIQTGEVELHKEVVTEQKNIDIPVTREEVYIQQHPVGRQEISDTPIGADETINIPVSEEQVHVNKIPVETGEVSIGKRSIQDTDTITDTVRKEQVHIDQEGDAPIHGTRSDRFHPDQIREDDLNK